MLVIGRYVNEAFTVQTPSGPCVIKVTGMGNGGIVYIGIDAPKSWAVERDDMRKGKAPS